MNENQVIAIDGTSASGKGTIAKLVAKKLNWNYLDSGALYRLLALDVINKKTNLNDEISIANIAKSLDIEFKNNKTYLSKKNVTNDIRKEEISKAASLVARYNLVRAALLDRQRNYALDNNLVADGRDMASVVFPNAILKIFVIADLEIRAKRRALQLGISLNSPEHLKIIDDLKKRDEIDTNRKISPLIKVDDAHLLDNSYLSVKESVDFVMNLYIKLKK